MTGKAATLELAVLGLLHESPLHGYELRKRLVLLLGWSRVLSYGSLYPALKRLLRAGLVTEVTSDDPRVTRRQRIVYRLTPEGEDVFAHRITEVGPAAWEDEGFTMRFAFFSRTDVEVRLRVLEGRRSRLQERLDRARSSRPPSGPVDRYVSELQRHSIESVERELRWLTELIEAERTPRDGPTDVRRAGPPDDPSGDRPPPEPPSPLRDSTDSTDSTGPRRADTSPSSPSS